MQTTTDPLPRAGVLRAGLVSLGIPQLALGIWALISPTGFYGTFPVVAGQHWLPAYGPYDSHLVTDVGSTFLAIGLLMLLAAWFLERRVAQIALVVYLAYDIPHLVFHLRNDGVLSSGSQVVNGVALGLSALSAIALLGLLLRAPGSPAGHAPQQPGGSGSRVAPPKGGILTRIVRAYSRRQYGGETTPGDVFRHHVPLLLGYGAFETALERSHSVPERLKILGETKAATVVGCEWCMDFASYLARRHDALTDAELMDLPRYGESERFDELDRLVLDYAVAISRTPADVDDALFGRLRERFSDRQIVELTTAISLENFRARFNHALGMDSQGFSEGSFCVVPASAG
jgi:alkylhydroperoxidase family enzyme